MRFKLTEEQEQLRSRIAAFLDATVTPELLVEVDELPEGGPLWRQYIRDLGKAGWLGCAWPPEYGGMGLGPVEQYIVYEEITRKGVPIPYLTLQCVGPAIMRIGNAEQKQLFLPKILAGDLEIAIAYTEPDSGSDVASLRTAAVADGDDYVINGHKIFTTYAHRADYIWLAARTDPHAEKHRGISIFMVDTRTPGYSYKPLWVYGRGRTNYTFYDNVRVPKNCLIGEENRGWRYMTEQLNFERRAVTPASRLERLLDEMLAWAKQTTMDGSRVVDKAWVRDALADLTTSVEVLKLMQYRAAWRETRGLNSSAESSAIKFFGTELHHRLVATGMRIMELHGQLQTGSPRVPLQGALENLYQLWTIGTFGGGTNEIQRDLVAIFGLGMPRH